MLRRAQVSESAGGAVYEGAAPAANCATARPMSVLPSLSAFLLLAAHEAHPPLGNAGYGILTVSGSG